MPTNRNPVPTIPGEAEQVSILVDGDAVNESDLFFEASPGSPPKLTLSFLHDRVAGIAKYAPQLGQTQIVEQGIIIDTASPWVFYAGVVNVPTTHVLYQPLRSLAHGVKLTSVSFWITPTGHGGTLPTLPNIRVIRQPVNGTSLTTIGAQVTDPSANETAYDTAHAITCPITAGNGPGGTSEIIDLTQYLYFVKFTAEGTSNGNNNTAVFGAVSTVAYV